MKNFHLLCYDLILIVLIIGSCWNIWIDRSCWKWHIWSSAQGNDKNPLFANLFIHYPSL